MMVDVEYTFIVQVYLYVGTLIVQIRISQGPVSAIRISSCAHTCVQMIRIVGGIIMIGRRSWTEQGQRILLYTGISHTADQRKAPGNIIQLFIKTQQYVKVCTTI